MIRRLPAVLCACLMSIALARPVHAQQRPLVTQDPEPIGPGRILIEGGLDASNGITYPVSGLKGNLLSVPTIGLSFGLSSIAELQIDGGLYNHLSITSRDPNAPLAGLLTVTGDSTHDISDATVGIKVRLLSETDSRPSFGIRFATKLPNASNESGLGTDTMDFSMAVLGAKTVQSIRIVGNIGAAIMSDPTDGNRQNDDLIYGVSLARAVTQAAELVGEVNGRWSTRSGPAFPGTETRGILKLGGRFTHGSVRVDAGVYFGLTSLDPTIGFTTGFTYVFNAFTLP
jgi:hypothetical protein